MKEITLPNFADLALALNQTILMLHPSEAQGLIAGLLCGDQREADGNWTQFIIGEKNPEKIPEILQELYALSQKQLAEFLFEFELVLPLDSQSLADRAEALTLWCQGFLTGLKIAHVNIAEQKGEMTEALNDIVEIAKMNYENVIDNEEDETAYIELVEYVRMAIILVYQELHEKKQTTRADQSIH